MTSHIYKNFLLPKIVTDSLRRRQLFTWLVFVFNRVDKNRIKEVGPDQACAEWLLRNGAKVKWTHNNEYMSDYNVLISNAGKSHIQCVDGTDSAINYVGFPYFEGCKYIEEVKLINCKYIENKAMSRLSILKESLLRFELIDCKSVSDEGILHLQYLKNLKELKLSKLPFVKNKEGIQNTLKDALPSCKIIYE